MYKFETIHIFNSNDNFGEEPFQHSNQMNWQTLIEND